MWGLIVIIFYVIFFIAFVFFRFIVFSTMRKEASLPVRLDTEAKDRLQAISDEMGLTVSAIVRLLVKSFVQEYDRSGGIITLPLEWKTSSASERAHQAGKPSAKVTGPKASKTRKR